MKHKMIFTLILTAAMIVSFSVETVPLKPIELSGRNGGFASGKVWKSNSLVGKTNVLFYVDPDKISDVKQLISILETQKTKTDNFGITYIVNTKATLVPTFIIQSKIKKKAKESETISYVLDKKKVLVSEWELQNNSANVLVLDCSNKILFRSSGKILQDQVDNILKIIDTNIQKSEDSKN
jgi:hypothetical protein